jgi:hypothetical protein
MTVIVDWYLILLLVEIRGFGFLGYEQVLSQTWYRQPLWKLDLIPS